MPEPTDQEIAERARVAAQELNSALKMATDAGLEVTVEVGRDTRWSALFGEPAVPMVCVRMIREWRDAPEHYQGPPPKPTR